MDYEKIIEKLNEKTEVDDNNKSNRIDSMNLAKKNKNDEFYTKLEDIDEEIQNYREEIKGKIIYCNCDNSKWSSFYRYFKENFKELQIKKLISTFYVEKTEENIKPYKTEFNGIEEVKTNLKGNGDFESEECIEILKSCDIVITNPPFSLSLKHIKTIVDNDKKFLVIGNILLVSKKYTFQLFKDYKFFYGYDKVTNFINNLGESKKVGAIWYQNIIKKTKPAPKPKPKIVYKKYDNYEAINVDKSKDIPEDYYGLMGVPITYLEKIDRDKFEVIEAITPIINGKVIFTRIIIKRIKQ